MGRVANMAGDEFTSAFGGIADATGIVAAAADHPDHAGAPDPCRNLVAAEFPQTLGDDPGGAVHVVQKLGMFVEIMAPGGDFIGERGDTIDNGHGDTREAGEIFRT